MSDSWYPIKAKGSICHTSPPDTTQNITAPYGVRTRVTAVRGQRPRPLDERSKERIISFFLAHRHRKFSVDIHDTHLALYPPTTLQLRLHSGVSLTG